MNIGPDICVFSTLALVVGLFLPGGSFFCASSKVSTLLLFGS